MRVRSRHLSDRVVDRMSSWQKGGFNLTEKGYYTLIVDYGNTGVANMKSSLEEFRYVNEF